MVVGGDTMQSGAASLRCSNIRKNTKRTSPLSFNFKAQVVVIKT